MGKPPNFLTNTICGPKTRSHPLNPTILNKRLLDRARQWDEKEGGSRPEAFGDMLPPPHPHCPCFLPHTFLSSNGNKGKHSCTPSSQCPSNKPFDHLFPLIVIPLAKEKKLKSVFNKHTCWVSKEKGYGLAPFPLVCPPKTQQEAQGCLFRPGVARLLPPRVTGGPPPPSAL